MKKQQYFLVVNRYRHFAELREQKVKSGQKGARDIKVKGQIGKL